MDRAARPRRGLELLASLAIPLGLVLAAPASADRTVSANQPVVVSDDITKRTIAVRSASGDEAAPSPGDDATATSGNDDNRSGLGDGTNPGMGDGRDNSPNEGTENPNQAPADRGKPASKGKKKK